MTATPTATGLASGGRLEIRLGAVPSGAVELDDASRGRALALVRELRDPATPDEETGAKLEELERIVRCPDVITLMFFNQPELTDEEVVAEALAYEPFAL